MTTITKTVKFDAAHVLTGHAGKCRNLHGHTYRVDVSVADLTDGGLVVDFGELKRTIEETVLSRFDHSFLYSTSSEDECEIAGVAERLGMRTAPLPFATTVENLSRHVFGLLEPKVKGLKSVSVWETADNCATYERQKDDISGH